MRRSSVKRLTARLSGGDDNEFVLQVVQPSLVGMIDAHRLDAGADLRLFAASSSRTALLVGLSTVAGVVVAIELLVIAWVRHRFLHVSLRSSLIVVTLGGALVLGIGVAIGSS
jgi:hypothetical protein